MAHWLGSTINVLGGEFRDAIRHLAGTPALTTAAILIVALAIGATVTVFSLLDRVLWKPLDVVEPSRLVVAARNGQGNLMRTGFWWGDYERLRATSMRTLGGLAASSDSGDPGTNGIPSVFRPGAPIEHVRGSFITANYFRVLGLTSQIGRGFSPADDVGGAELVTILSHRVWRSRFGGGVGAVGQTIEVNGHIVRIIGVAPRSFTGTDITVTPPDLFFPLMAAERLVPAGGLQTDGRGNIFSPGSNDAAVSPIDPLTLLTIVGRLREGVEIEQAQAELEVVVGPNETMTLVPLTAAAFSFQSGTGIRGFIALLAAAVSLTFLVGCANLANLLVVRVEKRRSELAVRMALGASRFRLARGLVVEAGVTALAGGAIGLLAMNWISRGLSFFELPGGIAISTLRDSIDARTVAFAVLVTAVFAFIISLAAVWRVASIDHLGNFNRIAGSSRRGAVRPLVGIQIGISIVLVFGAILFIRSVSEGLATDLGFEPDELMVASVSPPAMTTRAAGFRAQAAVEGLLDSVIGTSGVSNATIGLVPVLSGSNSSVDRVRVDGRAVNLPVPLQTFYVGQNYFATLRQDLAQGRDFTSADQTGAPVAIVNDAAARRLWPNQDPIGRSLSDSVLPSPFTIIGVARDAKIGSLRNSGVPAVYMTGSVFLGSRLFVGGNAFLIIRTRGGSASVFQSLDRLAADAGLSIGEVSTVDERIRALLMPQRLGRAMLIWLGIMGLMLTGAGIFGLVSNAVARSEKEIGVRRALGASRSDVVRTIMKKTLKPILAGIVFGTVVAWWAGGFADRFMYGIAGSDPATIVIAVATLSVLVSGVSLIPLRRAVRVSIVEVLRSE